MAPILHAPNRRRINGNAAPSDVVEPIPPNESPAMPSLELAFVELKTQFVEGNKANALTHQRAQEDRDRMERSQSEMKEDIRAILGAVQELKAEKQERKGEKAAWMRGTDVLLVVLSLVSPFIFHVFWK